MRKYLPLIALAVIFAAILGVSCYTDPSNQTKQADASGSKPIWRKLIAWPEGVTALAVICTLLVVAWQSVETRAAAIATEESVKSGKYSAKKQLRAYVCVNSAFLKFPNPALPRATVVVKNCGQTPAYEVKGWCGCVWDMYPSTKIMEPSDETFSSPVSVLGPDIPVSWGTTPSGPLPQELLPVAGSIKCTLYVTGEITYQDAFGDRHYTRYRLLYGGPNHRSQVITESDGTESWTMAPDTEGNEAD